MPEPPAVRSSGDRESYALEGWYGSFLGQAISGLGRLVPVVVLSARHIASAIAVGVVIVATTIYEWYVLAHRIETDDQCLPFVSWLRRVEVSWDEVVEVKQGRWFPVLCWRLSGHGRVQSSRNLEGLGALMADIERRTPTVTVNIKADRRPPGRFSPRRKFSVHPPVQ